MCHLRRLEPERALKVRVQLHLGDGSVHSALALVDTGAEYNLCNPRDVRTTQWRAAAVPIRLVAANDNVMEGGSQELSTHMHIQGWGATTGDCGPREVRLPATFYQAEVGAPLILSYSWMVDQGVVVAPAHGCMLASTAGKDTWVGGHSCEPQTPPYPQPVCMQAAQSPQTNGRGAEPSPFACSCERGMGRAKRWRPSWIRGPNTTFAGAQPCRKGPGDQPIDLSAYVRRTR